MATMATMATRAAIATPTASASRASRGATASARSAPGVSPATSSRAVATPSCRRVVPRSSRASRGRTAEASAGGPPGGAERTPPAASSSEDAPVGFVSVEENDEDGREVGDVSLRAQADYRKVEDPEWLERELLRADDGYPTSRGAVIAQSFKTRDYVGFLYAVSSVNASVALLLLAYVSLAAARVRVAPGEDAGALFEAARFAWKPLLGLGAASAAVEVRKFVDTVVGVQNRRKM